jgi:5-methylcytosine-specific restriction protein B
VRVAHRSGREEAYAVAERFVEEALKSDGSLFTPGRAIWSAENIEDLYKRFVENPDESSDSFDDKFRRQLEGAPPETRQLAAELLYIYLVFPSNIGGESKRRIVKRVLDGTSITVPDDLAQTLDHGIGGFVTSLANRPWHLTMLLEFFREWKTMPGSEEALSDPWKFKDIVFSVPHFKARIECEALLHLVHPDTFERIASQYHKGDVVKRFSYLPGEDTEDIDRRILEIREGLTPKYGDDFDFYDEEVRKLWSSEENEWDVFVQWARKFYEWDAFDENERDYKLEVSTRLERAKDALVNGERDWTKKLREAFWSKNNLTHFRQSQPFLKWCETNAEVAGEGLRVLWDESIPTMERVKGFSQILPKEVLSGRGGRLALASVLALATDPLDHPVYRWEPLDKAQKLLKYPAPDGSLDEAGLYEHSIEFFDRFLDEAGASLDYS